MSHSPVCKSDFPALQQKIDGNSIIYLDNAATTLKPRAVIKAVSDFYTFNGANIHRGKHRLSDEASNDYEHARLDISNYIGAQANELVFTGNTTHSLNIVAHGLQLSKQDIVLVNEDAHHSNILPWRQTADVRFIRTTAEGRLDLDHFRELLSLKPSVVALTHCSNVTGAVHPVGLMVKLIRASSDAVIVLDAAQSLPHERIDFHQLDVDFAAFSAHKMYGPTGVGLLYGKYALLEKLKPLQYGGGTVDWVDAKKQINRRAPYHLEAGTPAIASVLGTGAAVRYLLQCDESLRSAHDRALSEAMLKSIAERPFLSLLGPHDTKDRHAIFSVKFDSSIPAGELTRLLSDSWGIMCRSGYLCAQPFVTEKAQGEVIRISACIYNELSEIETLFSAIDELATCVGLATI
ncbi:aminotransferase class V-fold PLP-dependent enzyme [Serratia proteamaculans]|uniref:aminotransferase class V-fold PLP-dependent enzyme n=1 Tax=Serratia proteamaculans TaxID=28151 RepID=UPI0039B0D9ED